MIKNKSIEPKKPKQPTATMAQTISLLGSIKQSPKSISDLMIYDFDVMEVLALAVIENLVMFNNKFQAEWIKG